MYFSTQSTSGIRGGYGYLIQTMHQEFLVEVGQVK